MGSIPLQNLQPRTMGVQPRTMGVPLVVTTNVPKHPYIQCFLLMALKSTISSSRYQFPNNGFKVCTIFFAIELMHGCLTNVMMCKPMVIYTLL